jgi:hypothetical protein
MKSFDAPGATLTQAWGINNNGVVAVSADVGSFAYCTTSNCPGANAIVSGGAQHPVGKYVPAKP